MLITKMGNGIGNSTFAITDQLEMLSPPKCITVEPHAQIVLKELPAPDNTKGFAKVDITKFSYFCYLSRLLFKSIVLNPRHRLLYYYTIPT